MGKLKVLNTSEKEISIVVNDVEAPFKMKLGKDGEGFFEI
jgi:phosphatidate phosphatase PAH1